MFLNNLNKLIVSVNVEALKKGLYIMLFGLIGVFSVIILLYLVTKLLGSISDKKGDKDKR